ncbi:ornithine cyclodeaminase family protein [Arthrobacter castelli]|uniref:ornithine cyclodeaminase family protein n=1 Tax=Arthrobacter castelli TaxID=271431 RepID=UPI00040EBA27|nr:ornithine cyclodeaminase family protein [Arthrobacter castelli]
MNSTQPTWYSAEDTVERASPRIARRLIERALLDGFDPATDPGRINIPAGAGHLLIMPSTLGDWVGTKVASVAPGNPDKGLPRIQATYVLLDAETLTTAALMDGSALTTLRTPAVSAVAADKLAAPDAAQLTVFGTGPQALAHIVAFADIRELSRITVVGRNPGKVGSVVDETAKLGLPVEAGRAEDIAEADIVVCATSAAEPLFDGAGVKGGACVVAMGSHETGRRELDSGLMGRSQVVVEDAAAALREAGDVVMAVDDGALAAGKLVTLRDVVTGAVARRDDRPNVFKGVGMSWQDLAVAVGVIEADFQ